MNIAWGCDHSGYEGPPPIYKTELVRYIEELGHTVVDCGTFGPESVDYPDYANAVCAAILSGKADEGILMCGTGLGVAMAANRHKGVRAAVCTNAEMVKMAREHNNANVLCLGRRILTLDECERLIDTWFEARFQGGERHLRRIAKMG
ncbi:MAG TPA: ribose 5-phosphate isomerase B [Candidatus Hydrogenedentes bacterium]|nr:ribose 5-phosphate isomerase B [Candidatus Hydrogenedentota bacterium]HNT89858.1 ribose 5-phosphate isomerase B [Candidatus Hydrogenedentota bacterium]